MTKFSTAGSDDAPDSLQDSTMATGSTTYNRLGPL